MWMKWNYPNQVLEHIIYRYNAGLKCKTTMKQKKVTE